MTEEGKMKELQDQTQFLTWLHVHTGQSIYLKVLVGHCPQPEKGWKSLPLPYPFRQLTRVLQPWCPCPPSSWSLSGTPLGGFPPEGLWRSTVAEVIQQAREIEQESGTPMRRIMSGSQWGGLCQIEVSLTIPKNGEHTTYTADHRSHRSE